MDYRFDCIVDYYFDQGILLLKVNYVCGDNQVHTLEVPFLILKKDAPLELARYIQQHVIEMKRGGRYNTWSKKAIYNHHHAVRRIYCQYNINISPNNHAELLRMLKQLFLNLQTLEMK